MSCTQLLPGLGQRSTRVIGHPQIARNITACRSLTQLAIGLVIMAVIVIGLTNPSPAQTTGPDIKSTSASTKEHGGIPAFLARCLHDWDAGTHMTKKEWLGACQRLLIERGNYLPNNRRTGS